MSLKRVFLLREKTIVGYEEMDSLMHWRATGSSSAQYNRKLPHLDRLLQKYAARAPTLYRGEDYIDVSRYKKGAVISSRKYWSFTEVPDIGNVFSKKKLTILKLQPGGWGMPLWRLVADFADWALANNDEEGKEVMASWYDESKLQFVAPEAKEESEWLMPREASYTVLADPVFQGERYYVPIRQNV
jgi:hypothetical protein